MPPVSVKVEGIREVSRAFAQVDKSLKKDMQRQLAEAGEPARAEAEVQAVANIRNIGDRWSQVRIGVTTSNVYLAPKARRRGGKPRGNLGGLLLMRALLPAAHEKEPEVRDNLEDWLDHLGRTAGF